MYAIVSSNQWLLISVINDMNTTEMTTLQPPSTQDYSAARLQALLWTLGGENISVLKCVPQWML